MLKDYMEEAISLGKALIEDENVEKTFESVVAATVLALQKGGKILAAGNGGSAADVQHFTAEFVAKYKMERKAIPAIALTTDVSIITAIGNDYDFAKIFGRQVEALGREGDIFFAVTTSGNSENLILALAAARQQKLVTVALLGKGGGRTKGIADYEIVIPSDNTPRIQEVQKTILHSIAEEVEKRYCTPREAPHA